MKKMLMTPAKLGSLLDLLASVRHLNGNVAELGVYAGSTLEAMALVATQKICYGFDTFAGLPAQSWSQGDFHRPGEFGDVSYQEIYEAMPKNVTLIRGLFPESARGIEDRFCFAHVDFDLEQSTMDAIEWLKPRLVAGGLMVFDDWHWSNCEGVDRAIARSGLEVKPSAGHNQCYWTAPC